tara:strand:- start:2494 stop:2949 length:456 start_codon:yes stop_codon:yes gene_type:complete
MIQILYEKGTTSISIPKINLRSYYTSDYEVNKGFLVNLKSHFTGKDLFFTPGILSPESDNNDRFRSLFIFVTSTTLLPLSAVIKLGTTDYPLGFYDFIVYLNTSTTNLDPTGLALAYSGLANVRGADNAKSVKYSEYTTNDADTESVYITL